MPTANAGYTFDSLALSGGTCSGTTCSATDVVRDLTVVALFTEIASTDTSDTSTTDTDTSDTGATTVTITVKPAATGGGSVTCDKSTVEHGGSTTCTATVESGYTFSDLTLDSGTATIICSGTSCTVTDITSDVVLLATFRAAAVAGSAQPVPTLGEVGLLLSGLALAGAAAPALRRRERNEREQRKRA